MGGARSACCAGLGERAVFAQKVRDLHRNFTVATSDFCGMILSNGREIFQRREKNQSQLRIGRETHFGQPETSWQRGSSQDM